MNRIDTTRDVCTLTLIPNLLTHGWLSLTVRDPHTGAQLAQVEATEQGATLLWTIIDEQNDAVIAHWPVPSLDRPYDTRRDDGAATDVLLAFVWPSLRVLLAEIAPHVDAPPIHTARALMDAHFAEARAARRAKSDAHRRHAW